MNHFEQHSSTENQVVPPPLPIHQQKATPSPTPTVKPNGDFCSEKIDDSHYNQIEDGNNRKKRRMENRNGCLRCLCCACCLPAWAAGIVWFIIIAIIIVIIVLATIAGTFVMPTVNMAGVSTSPVGGGSQITISGGTFNINFGLIISVNNPNMLSIDLTELSATAYYPNQNGKGHTKIGGGYLAEHFVPTYSNDNFTFPFAIKYNPALDTDQSVLNDLASKCGLTGEEKQDITVDYTIHLAAKVLFIKIRPTISSSATFPCPISSNGAIDGIGDGTLSGLD
ncbi:hypothetical protein G6F37_006979 [Rhizopus arrhizus]|jgi:LEA14-like dessication related protein|nr:hypothetical protein G6F38_005951 [Rhizopus arrhizus]KAG1157128.1 hypothetical protein G6F37_006979 [Rhizopus arrhizus]